MAYIYGTGKTAAKLYKGLTERGICIKGFLQRTNSEGEYPNFVEKLAEVYDFADESICDMNEDIYIGIENAMAPIRKIIGNLRAAGWHRIIPYIQLIDRYPEWIASYLYLEPKQMVRERKHYLEEARKIYEERFIDDQSLDLFDALMRFREDKDYDVLPEIDDDIYLPSEISEWWKPPVSFVDCGAFNGDTLLSVAKAFDKIETYIALEPDKHNFSVLKSIQCSNIDHFNAYPYGAWNVREKLKFLEEGAESSRISVNGSIVIDCISLDELLADTFISHIKMDIEGAELKALLGAEKIIKKYRPRLAISVYHKPQDIYEILFLLEKWNLDYKYCLRAYGDTGTDCVLYAI